MESNLDWNMCIDNNGMRMGRCVHACNGNEACELDCLAWFKTRQMDCPCEVSILNIKGSPEGSSEQEFRRSILCDVIEISG